MCHKGHKWDALLFPRFQSVYKISFRFVCFARRQRIMITQSISQKLGKINIAKLGPKMPSYIPEKQYLKFVEFFE